MKTDCNSSVLDPTHKQGTANQMGQPGKRGLFCGLIIGDQRGAAEELGVTEKLWKKGAALRGGLLKGGWEGEG